MRAIGAIGAVGRASLALPWLLHLPFLRAVDLAVFCQVSPATAQRWLDRLDRAGLVEAVEPPRLATQAALRLYHPSDRGLAWLAGGWGMDPATLGRAWRADEANLLRQLPRLARVAGAQAFAAALLRGADVFLGDRGSRAHGEWACVRDYRHPFLARGHPRRVTADLAVVVRARAGAARREPRGAPARWYGAFAVVDTPVQDWRAIARRLEAFALHRASPERWATFPAFPPLLVLARDERHAERWHALAAEQASARELALPGAVAVLPVGALLAEGCDPWRAAWTELGTGRAVHLADVLVPLPVAVLPDGLVAPPPPPPPPSSPVSHAPPDARVVRPRERPTTGGGGAGGRRVLLGHFQGRAARVQDLAAALSDRAPSAQRERRMLRLLALRLAGRHLQVLDALFSAQAIHPADLADLLAVLPASAERYLSELDRLGLLTWLRDEATPARPSPSPSPSPSDAGPATGGLVGLSARGVRLVAARHGLAPRARAVRSASAPQRWRRAGPGGMARARHAAGIQHLFALVARAAPGGGELVWWETGAATEYRYRDHGRWHNLRPDGAGLYRAGGRRFRFWVEHDRGTMGLRDLTGKFAAYAAFLASGRWRELPDRALPHLLIVVQDLGQLDRMRRAAARAFGVAGVGGADLRPLHASITLASRLEAAGPLAPIWWPLLPAAPDGGEPPDADPGRRHARGTPVRVFPSA